mgnify:CR=1 FL=1
MNTTITLDTVRAAAQRLGTAADVDAYFVSADPDLTF